MIVQVRTSNKKGAYAPFFSILKLAWLFYLFYYSYIVFLYAILIIMEKMKNFLKNAKAWVMALGVAVLTGLSQVTISGANVQLETSDVSSISTSLWQGFTGLLHNVVELVPVLALITFAWLVIRFVAKKARAK